MNPPGARSRTQSPGGGKGGKGAGDGGKGAGKGKSSGLKKLWCNEFLKSGTCAAGDKCPFPHHDQKSVDAIKLGLENAKKAGAPKAAAKAKPKAKARAKAS